MANPLIVSPTIPALPGAAAGIANRLRRMPNDIFAVWSNGVNLLWNNPKATPQQIFTALGTDGAPLLAASAALVAALEDQAPGCTAATLALVQPVTVASDGTVTVNPPVS